MYCQITRIVLFTSLILNVLTSSMFDNNFNVNDVLRTDLMPTYFIINGENQQQIINNTRSKNMATSVNGSINAALSTLIYHRKMMNEYQCRNFLAGQILEEIGKPVLQNRLGKPYHLNENNLLFRRSQDIRSNFLYDVGSANYQDWLAKVTALNDVYKHYNTTSSANVILNDTTPLVNFQNRDIQSRDGYEVYEDVSGYPESMLRDVSKYSSGFEYSMPPPPPPLYQHPLPQGQEQVTERNNHGLGLADLFEISLTGIAFLSFGMFVLQVLMCITMNPQDSQLMQMVNNNGDTVNIDEVFRFKRESEQPKRLSTINSLSRYALMALRPRSTQCLYRALCLGNKHVRELQDSSRYWLPVWQ